MGNDRHSSNEDRSTASRSNALINKNSLIGVYLNCIASMGEDRLAELISECNKIYESKLKAIDPVIMDWDLIKKMVPRKLKVTLPTIIREYEDLTKSFDNTFAGQLRSGTIRTGLDGIEKVWKGDYFDNRYSLEFESMTCADFLKPILKISSEKGLLPSVVGLSVGNGKVNISKLSIHINENGECEHEECPLLSSEDVENESTFKLWVTDSMGITLFSG